VFPGSVDNSSPPSVFWRQTPAFHSAVGKFFLPYSDFRGKVPGCLPPLCTNSTCYFWGEAIRVPVISIMLLP